MNLKQNQTAKSVQLKEFELWIGYYSLGQGYDPPNEPEIIGKEYGSDFTLACLKYELKTMLKSIEERDNKGEYVNHQSREWFYNWRTNTNSWTGKYFETKEEAWQSFPEYKRPSNQEDRQQQC